VSGSSARRADVEALVADYRADLIAAGMFADNPVTSVARMFFTRVGVEGWARLSLAEQCALPLKDRRVVGWLIVTGRVRPSPDYLVACRPYLGEVAAHHHRVFHERFRATSAELGFDRIVTRLQWSALAKVAAVSGLTIEHLTATTIQAGQHALAAAIGRHRPDSHGVKALSAALFGAQTTLFHLGVLDSPPRKTTPNRSAERAAAWTAAPPRLAATLTGYIAQTRLSLRASTMVRVEGVLREFAGWLAQHAPEVDCVADLRRRHIEGYKLHLAARPSARGGTLTKTSLAEHLGTLRTCFERLAEWGGGDDVAAAVLVFAGDLPLRDAPLPRFLDDGAFTKLLQAARADTDPFVRLAVEFLARTGLRKGEFLDLTVDSVVQIGAAYWLHGHWASYAATDTSRCTPSSSNSSTTGSPSGQPACAARTCSSSTASGSGRAASTKPTAGHLRGGGDLGCGLEEEPGEGPERLVGVVHAARTQDAGDLLEIATQRVHDLRTHRELLPGRQQQRPTHRRLRTSMGWVLGRSVNALS